MRVLIFACLILFASCDSIVFKRFLEFTHKYNKVYSSMEEFNQKFEVFKNNLIEILAEDDFEGPHILGITQFSDLTKQEFAKQYLTLKTPVTSWCHSGEKFLAPKSTLTSLDWRTKGGVSPVKNQGQCGSCWAFSAVGFLESQSLIVDMKARTYSEQQLVDCDHLGDQGCNGGLMQTAMEYIQQKGIESDTDYPYRARKQTCQYSQAKTKATVDNIKCYEKISNAQMQQMLATVGPLAIAVDASTFQFYRGGILQCKGTALNHGVLLIGFTQDTWIIKNSWGTGWGEDGFVRTNNKVGYNCGTGTYVVTAILK